MPEVLFNPPLSKEDMKKESPVRKPKKERTLRVCDSCGVPMIWTFAFSYCERYCLNCGRMGGMFGTGTDVPLTRELVFQSKIVNALWKVIYGKKGFLPNGRFGKSNCKKESSCSDHRSHLTKSEQEWDSIGNKYLEQLKGFLTPSK